jgi:hypothetical protein
LYGETTSFGIEPHGAELLVLEGARLVEMDVFAGLEAAGCGGAGIPDGGFHGHGTDGGIREKLILAQGGEPGERARPASRVGLDDARDLPKVREFADGGHLSGGVRMLGADLADAKGRS